VKGKDLGFKFWAALAVSAIGMGVVLAFVAGFFLGHFTGHHSTTTVAATSVTSTTESGEEGAESGSEKALKASEEEAAQEAAEEEAAKEEAAKEKVAKEEAAKEEAAAGGGKEASGGEAVLAVGKGIVESTCSACHTLSEAGATGTVGPNLDELKPSKSLVEHQVINGGAIMPAFGNTFSSSEIEAVAEYVSKVAGTGNTSLGG
jgi:mono/diheme cytochrome c family protein